MPNLLELSTLKRRERRAPVKLNARRPAALSFSFFQSSF